MKPELVQQIFDNSPEDEPRSKLDAYGELILRWRRQGRSYRKIRELARTQCNLTMSLATLHGFIKRRSRPRKSQPKVEAEQRAVMPAAQIQPASIPDQTPGIHAKLSPEEAARRRELLQSLRNKSALEPKPTALKEFRYDPDQPLTIDRTIKD